MIEGVWLIPAFMAGFLLGMFFGYVEGYTERSNH